MHILLVKTSSLGDVIHNLPVVTDLCRAFPEARIDWCVEAPFAALPALHPGVSQVLPVALRRWRKQWTCPQTRSEVRQALAQLQARTYDVVLDTQGLIKSALLTRLARVHPGHGQRCGYDRHSAREGLAALAYDRRFAVSRSAHAVLRNRQLAAAAFGYALATPTDYGLSRLPATADALRTVRPAQPYALLLTATSRDDKLWPEAHWISLGRQLAAQGLRLLLPGGSPVERARAARLAAEIPGAHALPPSDLGTLASLLGGARLAVGVDTGLMHLAAALSTPSIALFTATDPLLTGVHGPGLIANLGGVARCPTPEAVLAQATTFLECDPHA